MGDVFPETRDTQADFGEGSRGGSDDREPVTRNGGQEFFGAGQSNDIGDVLNFGSLHPLILCHLDSRLDVRQEFSNRGEAGAPMSEFDDVFGVHIVFLRPASPDAGDGRGRVNEDAVHVDQQALAQNLSHVLILARA